MAKKQTKRSQTQKSKKNKFKKRIAKKITARPKKKVTKKSVAQKKVKPTIKTRENIIGVVTHYFPKVNAAAIKLKAPLKIGDAIKIKGHTTDFSQTVTSMQINRVPITSARKGQEIGLLVNSRVRRNDLVYPADISA
ncbi:MAG: hypothetical protein NC828_00655 [Candidatus Omnitrophica bacterium]|nr:hypothetical protein [Candidatus Omnitrophota bacterium]